MRCTPGRGLHVRDTPDSLISYLPFGGVLLVNGDGSRILQPIPNQESVTVESQTFFVNRYQDLQEAEGVKEMP